MFDYEKKLKAIKSASRPDHSGGVITYDSLEYIKYFITAASTSKIPNICLEVLIDRARFSRDHDEAIAAAKLIEQYAFGMCTMHIDPFSAKGISSKQLTVN